MIRSPEIFKVLQTSPLFQGVSGKLLVQKLDESKLRTLNSGEALLVPGQVNNTVYMILSGRLNIQLSKDPGDGPIAVLGEGECVGEESLIGEVYTPTYVIAATDCKLLAIEHAALWELIDNSHQAAHNMLRALSMRIRLPAQVTPESHEGHHGFSGIPLIDEMTGLYNQQGTEEKIGRYLRRHAFDKRPSCLMMVAIDRFKELDNQYGQLGSEQVLRDTARTMLSCLRPDDQAGRLLDEQFAVFMPHTTLVDGCVAAERLRTAINSSVIVLPTGDALPPVTVSLGLSPVNLNDTPASLFSRANKALRQAMESGGNCIKWWGQALEHEATQPAADANTAQPIKPSTSL